MLDFSRSERYVILTFLILGLLFTSISYSKKVSSRNNIRLINVSQRHAAVNINRATPQQLERLSGIGRILAQDIISYREQMGGFKELEEIKNVKGIGKKKFEKLKDLIVIHE